VGSGNSDEICLEESAAILIPRGEICSLRLEDRMIDGRAWYFVSVYLTQAARERLREELALPRRDGPHAVMIDGEISFAYRSGVFALDWPVRIAQTEDLAAAERTARAWDAPVERILSAEIAEQPVLVATMTSTCGGSNESGR
jgi:hypothetical protein